MKRYVSFASLRERVRERYAAIPRDGLPDGAELQRLIHSEYEGLRAIVKTSGETYEWNGVDQRWGRS